MPISIKNTARFNPNGNVYPPAAAGVAGAYAATVSTGSGAAAYGHLADPSWPGSFTGGVFNTSPTAVTNQTYSYCDFKDGANVGSVSVPANNVTYRGCRFQFSKNVDNVTGDISSAQALVFGANATFLYCTFQPSVTNFPSGAPTGTEVNGSRTTYVEYGKGYQYAIVGSGGYNTFATGITVDKCDFWGFGNAIELASSTVANPHIVKNSWFHHGADPFVEHQSDSNQIHNDCWLVNGGNYRGAQCLNNIMEIWGNTNLLAWQSPDGVYDDAVVTGNRFSGDQESILFGTGATAVRVTFTDNVFSTRIGRSVGSGKPLRSWNVSDSGTGSLWRRNTWLVAAGASTGNYPGGNWGNPSWNGQYWYPSDTDSGSGHATDYTG